MTVTELINKSVKPIEDLMNGSYRVFLPTKRNQQGYCAVKYLILHCPICGEDQVKENKPSKNKVKSCVKMDCVIKFAQSKIKDKTGIWDGKVITFDDVPEKFGNFNKNKCYDPVSFYIKHLKERPKRLARSNKHYLQNKERYSETWKERYKLNKKSICAYQAEYRKKNPEMIAKRQKQWYKDNFDKITAKAKALRETPEAKAAKAAYNKIYYQTEKGIEVQKRARKVQEKKPVNILKRRIRCSVKRIIRDSNNGHSRPANKYGIVYQDILNKLEKDALDIGYTLDEIKQLDFHMDHIIPVSLYDFSIKKDIKNCNSPYNLRWLSAQENLKRGNKLRPQDIEIIKTLPKEIYPKSWKGKIPKETING